MVIQRAADTFLVTDARTCGPKAEAVAAAGARTAANAEVRLERAKRPSIVRDLCEGFE
jgi:hypothetical protein